MRQLATQVAIEKIGLTEGVEVQSLCYSMLNLYSQIPPVNMDGKNVR